MPKVPYKIFWRWLYTTQILEDENPPRICPKGIIRTVYKAKNRNVRKVAVETSGKLFIRPTAKLAKLDVKSSSWESLYLI